MLLAAAWPQAILGALARSVFFWLPGLSAYMVLAFLAYLFNFYCVFGEVLARLQDLKLRATAFIWVICLFIFPVTLQYGLAFLTETFVVSFLFIYLFSLRSWLERATLTSALGVVAMTLVVVLQRQTYFIFPIGICAVLVFQTVFGKRAWQTLLPSLIGIILALLAYGLVPKTFYQTAFIHAVADHWTSGPGLKQSLLFLSRVGQLILAIGLFLTPLGLVGVWNRRKFWGIFSTQVVFTFVIFQLPGAPLTAGVLFTGYLPRLIGSMFISSGLWGLSGARDALRGVPRLALVIGCFAALSFLLFTTFMEASDVKYVLPAAQALFLMVLLLGPIFDELAALRRRKILVVSYFAVLASVSLITNRYYLDTLEARFGVAQTLAQSGIDQRSISAGYGRDSYLMGEECLKRGEQKLLMLPESERAGVQRLRLIDPSPRQYEDDAIFRFVVKPFVVMGKHVDLTKNRSIGQSNEPRETVAYRVLGIPNALAVFENDSPRLAWCFRP